MKERGLPHFPNPNIREFPGQPDSSFDLINCYGTYNIQPTANTENTFPAIAQGLAKSKKAEKASE